MCAVVPVCVVVPVRKSRKDVSSRGGAKECCLRCRQADIIAMACPLLTFYSGNAAAKFAKCSIFVWGTLPDLFVTNPLGGYVNTREEVAALRAKNVP